MRTTLLLLMFFSLAGCVDDSAYYYIDGRDHSLTIRRQQEYFWKDEVATSLVAARLPDCQRVHPLDSVMPSSELKVELFAAGDGLWNVRLGNRLWQIETQTCNGLTELQNDPKADLGQPVGTFAVRGEKLVFEATPAAHQ